MRGVGVRDRRCEVLECRGTGGFVNGGVGGGGVEGGGGGGGTASGCVLTGSGGVTACGGVGGEALGCGVMVSRSESVAERIEVSTRRRICGSQIALRVRGGAGGLVVEGDGPVEMAILVVVRQDDEELVVRQDDEELVVELQAEGDS